MERKLISTYAINPRNVGDFMSSPIHYFDFPGWQVETLDFRSIDPDFPTPQGGFGGSIGLDQIKNTSSNTRYHLIVGGGGLLFQRFWKCFQQLQDIRNHIQGQWIIWGAGQQIYPNFKLSRNKPFIDQLQENHKKFDYSGYVDPFSFVGIRDFNQGYDWVPCVSCMSKEFDKHRVIKHEFVVFSHEKFKIKIGSLPQMTHNTQNLQEVLDFLGSGETILTSSYHGAYWGMLLGRRVLAFPFSTKFLTLRNHIGIYPVSQWKYSRLKIQPFKTTFLNKLKWEVNYGNHFWCFTRNWKRFLPNQITKNSSILQEHRKANIQFYERIMQTLKET
jgi:hypothetical protein